MLRSRGKYVLIITSLVTFLIFIQGHFQNNIQLVNRSLINILSVDDLPEIDAKDCKELPESSYLTKLHLCPRDLFMKYATMSAAPLGYPFESHEVMLTLYSLDNYPNAVFLDIGANIGIYSIAAAVRGRQVYSVDAVKENLLHIHKAAELSSVEDRIVLINNAVSDNYEVLYTVMEQKSNVGGVRMVKAKDTKDGIPVNPLWYGTDVGDKMVEQAVLGTQGLRSVLLQDILNIIQEDTVIIKIDIEGYECKALTGFLQEKVKEKFVPYIVMEWNIISAVNQPCAEYNDLIAGFTESGYEPYSPFTEKIQDLKLYEYTNLFWKHKDAKDVPFLNELKKQNIWL